MRVHEVAGDIVCTSKDLCENQEVAGYWGFVGTSGIMQGKKVGDHICEEDAHRDDSDH